MDTSQRETTDPLREALRLASFPLDTQAIHALQKLVCAFVDTKRAAGWPIERILAGLKRTAYDGGLSGGGMLVAEHELSDRERTFAVMVRWCIDHYYAAAVSD